MPLKRPFSSLHFILSQRPGHCFDPSFLLRCLSVPFRIPYPILLSLEIRDLPTRPFPPTRSLSLALVRSCWKQTTMQLPRALLSLLFAFSLVAASPVDRVKLEKLKRQNEGNVIQVTVTDLYTVTVSSTVPQSTTTVTVVAAVGDAIVPPAITTSTTSTIAAPVATDTPVAAVQPPTSPTTSSDSPAATTPSTNSDATRSGGSSSHGSTYTGQGTFYDTGSGSLQKSQTDNLTWKLRYHQPRHRFYLRDRPRVV